MRMRRIRSQPSQTKFDPTLIVYACATRVVREFLDSHQLTHIPFHLTIKIEGVDLYTTIQTGDSYTAMLLRMEQLSLSETIAEELQKVSITLQPQLKIVIRPIAAQDAIDLPNQPTV